MNSAVGARFASSVDSCGCYVMVEAEAYRPPFGDPTCELGSSVEFCGDFF